jgi:hypothetical protein
MEARRAGIRTCDFIADDEESRQLRSAEVARDRDIRRLAANRRVLNDGKTDPRIDAYIEKSGEETRNRRLKTSIIWLAEGKPRNWKYIASRK